MLAVVDTCYISVSTWYTRATFESLDPCTVIDAKASAVEVCLSDIKKLKQPDKQYCSKPQTGQTYLFNQ